MERNRLTEEQKKQYREKGYLIDLPPIFTGSELDELQYGFKKIGELLEPGEDYRVTGRWHITSKWLYDLCNHPQILDYVEDIIGPNFYLWSTQFFAKPPKSSSVVPWHQDSHYWPLKPHNTASVWIAFSDVDEENGAMKVIPGTHKAGLLKHKDSQGDAVLTFELEKGQFSEEDAVSLVLKAGQISLHDDAIVHGSPANHSERWRIGMVVRYSSTNVKCDLNEWPEFLAFQVRGVDEFNLNPKGEPPTEPFARLPKEFLTQGSYAKIMRKKA